MSNANKSETVRRTSGGNNCNLSEAQQVTSASQHCAPVLDFVPQFVAALCNCL